MRIDAACFTAKGWALGESIKKRWAQDAHQVSLTRCGQNGPTVADWTKDAFAQADALLFIGAAGIAVRAIAPLIMSKTSDPAVLVIDEAGRYVIALLSGHIGGANALATKLAASLGAHAIITTATDLSGVFAVDTWAVQNGYAIQNPERIKRISATLLAGETVTLHSDFPVAGSLPDGMQRTTDTKADIRISVLNDDAPDDQLVLTPPALVLGVGCRKGTSQAALEAAFLALCSAHHFEAAAWSHVCSIDLKKHEPGLVAFCEHHGWPLHTYTAAELAQVPGHFSDSSFVAEITGVSNVCERAAVLGSGGKLLVQKEVKAGITVAVAQKDWVVRFEEQA